ncbi:MAG TPA: hypothetical protein VK602_00870, partial [Phyllobacterium sp.]|nr:hypothetical protein [Phyllobacterium sp.]
MKSETTAPLRCANDLVLFGFQHYCFTWLLRRKIFTALLFQRGPSKNVESRRGIVNMRTLVAAAAALIMLSACTTTEKDLSIGTVAGAAIGGIAGGGKGA